MKSFLRSNRNIIGLLLGFYTLLNCLIWHQLTDQIESDRSETLSSAIQHNNNLVISLEQHTIRTIRDADATLQLMKMEYEQDLRGLQMEKLLSKSFLNMPFFNGLLITDSTGKMVKAYPSSLLNDSVSLGDRPYFLQQKQLGDTLLISKPLLSRTIHQTVVVLSRRISDRRGRFLGCIAIQLLPSNFMAFYSQASLKKYDLLSLVSPDGMTYARRTGKVESSGEDIHKSPLFHYLQVQPVGNFFAKDAIRGIPTYFSYRKLKDLPIVATVGSSERDILGNFRLRQRRDYFFGMVISFLLLVFLLAVFLAFRQRKKSLQVLRKSEARYRSIFESSHDAILLVRPDGVVDAMNPAACDMFKLSLAEGTAIAFQQLYKKTEPEIVYSMDGNSHPSIQGKEVLFHCLNGSKVIGDIASAPLYDDRERQLTLVHIRDVTQRKRIQQKLQNEQKRYQRIMTQQIIVAQERERESIGHELHDNVNQILTTVKLYLETTLQKDNGKNDLIARCISYLMQCIGEIRNLSHSLSAPTLGTRSLVDSLQALIENVSNCTDFDIDFSVEKYQQPIGKELSLAIYRIVQEQFNNIIKHASASLVTVRLLQTETATQLIIEDNGCGFEPSEQHNGIGLNNISSRVKAFSGKLSIESARGKGCRLFVELPLADELELSNAEWY